MLSGLSWFSSALVFLITLILKVYTNMKPKVCFLLVSFEIIFCVEATNLGLPWVLSQVRVTAEAVVTAGNCASWFLVSGQSLDMLSLILWAFSLLFCRYPLALVVWMLINGMVLSLLPWDSFQDFQLVWPGVFFLLIKSSLSFLWSQLLNIFINETKNLKMVLLQISLNSILTLGDWESKKKWLYINKSTNITLHSHKAPLYNS